ncbi:MAG: hypothetical protein GX456_08670 [Verrucomicrobia bacterium]|nr:hypothetical protein [Verrucomicrobiota bacterium]
MSLGKSNDGQERGRPRPHQPDARSCTRFVHANPTPELSPAGGGQECPRSRSDSEKPNGPGSAAVPGRINPTTDLAPVWFTQIRRQNFHRLGAGKNARAPAAGWGRKLRVCPHIYIGKFCRLPSPAVLRPAARACFSLTLIFENDELAIVVTRRGKARNWRT